MKCLEFSFVCFHSQHNLSSSPNQNNFDIHSQTHRQNIDKDENSKNQIKYESCLKETKKFIRFEKFFNGQQQHWQFQPKKNEVKNEKYSNFLIQWLIWNIFGKQKKISYNIEAVISSSSTFNI